jgi:hypothetical protein
MIQFDELRAPRTVGGIILYCFETK